MPDIAIKFLLFKIIDLFYQTILIFVKKLQEKDPLKINHDIQIHVLSIILVGIFIVNSDRTAQ